MIHWNKIHKKDVILWGYIINHWYDTECRMSNYQSYMSVQEVRCKDKSVRAGDEKLKSWGCLCKFKKPKGWGNGMIGVMHNNLLGCKVLRERMLGIKNSEFKSNIMQLKHSVMFLWAL